MQIHNLRFGFATNSSSTHSIIFFPQGHNYHNSGDLGEFGWEDFTCASKEAKLHYLAQTIKDPVFLSMKADYDPWGMGSSKENILKKDFVFKLLKSLTTEDIDEKGYIDHQSKLSIPMSWDECFIDLDFFEELKNYLMQDNMIIVGGNDNDDYVHPAVEKGDVQYLPFREMSHSGSLVCRKDPENNYWTLFDREGGNKIRFSFGERVKPTKAFAPELIDIKITDYCDKGCAFCYQNSSIKGKHAGNLYQLTMALSNLKVFEVALGGGEPTSHPKFINILKDFRQYGIVPNFSTKSLSWLRDNKKWPEIIKLVGGFAYSVQSAKEINEFVALLEMNGIKEYDSSFSNPKVSVQYVLGSTTPYEIGGIVRAAIRNNIRLTLLDFKNIGKGEHFKYYKYDKWLEYIGHALEEYKGSHYLIGIDTPLAAKYKEELIKFGVAEHLFETKEGTFSMYIDAVNHKCGPSSYCNKDEMVSLSCASYKEYEKEILKIFKSF